MSASAASLRAAQVELAKVGWTLEQALTQPDSREVLNADGPRGEYTAHVVAAVDFAIMVNRSGQYCGTVPTDQAILAALLQTTQSRWHLPEVVPADGSDDLCPRCGADQEPPAAFGGSVAYCGTARGWSKCRRCGSSW